MSEASHGSHHGHAHHHGHGHAHAPVDFTRAFVLGITLNTIFVVIEAGCGWYYGSLALLADAGHNLGDVAGLLLAWGATWAGKKRATTVHTYGWQRATILAACANALLLLVAMVWLSWEAISRFSAPAPAAGGVIMGVAGIGLLINAGTAWLFFRGSAGDLNIRGAFLHMVADALVSLGVVIAGALLWWQQWAWIDPVVSLIIVVVVLVGTWGLLRQSLRLLFDGVPHAVDAGAVATYLEKLPGVTAVHDLHIWGLSTSTVALTAHLIMPEGHPGDAFLRQCAHELQTRFTIGHATIQIEQVPFCAPCDQHGGSTVPQTAAAPAPGCSSPEHDHPDHHPHEHGPGHSHP